ncbi:hypothetical protein QJS10_CPB04g00465 [Acorus calamus]|uniref:glutathione transferase n=1 Tax=Acorus calamus TaxID=4465 RepID=A0AAV9F212_ACOCL|nr:hypothetical protein QJS10_CPB04g00465 [Acorus calamus]
MEGEKKDSPPAPPLKLLGSWSSSYTHRVQLGLKLKGLSFEYFEEDLTNKSLSLLQHNPIHKKVPVLLHHDRPIVESFIILQYIDDVWTDRLPLFPHHDPYELSLVRFWSHFIDDKLGPAVGAVFRLTGEEQKAAVEEVHGHLQLIEDELREGHFKGRAFFGGDGIGALDIVVGCGSYWLPVLEEVAEVKLVDPERFPLFHAWLSAFEDLDDVKGIMPAPDRLLEYAGGVRQFFLTQGK